MIHILGFVADFFAGAFLCNCLPHLVSGLQGVPFPTPFAKPPGVGKSSSIVNFFWGSFNLFVGVALVACHPPHVGLHLHFALFVVGFLVAGFHLSWHFSKVR